MNLKKGNRVVYKPVRHAAPTSTGVIVKVLTRSEHAGSQQRMTHASEEKPRYLIENENTHKESVYGQEDIVQVLD